jgi:hypothetical protein
LKVNADDDADDGNNVADDFEFSFFANPPDGGDWLKGNKSGGAAGTDVEEEEVVDKMFGKSKPPFLFNLLATPPLVPLALLFEDCISWRFSELPEWLPAAMLTGVEEEEDAENLAGCSRFRGVSGGWFEEFGVPEVEEEDIWAAAPREEEEAPFFVNPADENA